MSTSSSKHTSGSEIAPKGSQPRFAREVAGNVLLSLIFLSFALANGRELLDSFRLSTILLLLKVSTDVIFYLTRRIPKDVSTSAYDWFIALAGTYTVVFLRPGGSGQDLLIGQLLQSFGLSLQIFAMLSLNRSIGMVAANRGIKTDGMYAYVRHPLYLSYVIAYGGYVVSQASPYNLGVFLAAVCLWFLRLLAEERFLMKAADYREYATRTRWRLIPYVF